MAKDGKGVAMIYDKRKDEAPEATVRKIQECLGAIGITCEYTFYDQEVPDCYSARVWVKGMLSNAIVANGKGTTKEFCLASGFAELMERIQNQMFLYQIQQRDEESPYIHNRPGDGSLCRMVDWKVLAAEKDSFFHRVVSRYAKTADQVLEGVDREQLVLLQFEKLFPRWEKDGVLTLPFYHVQSGVYEWIPLEVVKSLNMSNGMAAGNTLEEALVQGYSELLERYVQRQVIEHNLTPPLIEKEELDSYPYVKTMIERIESSGPYRVLVRDCSMGKDLPVVCGIVINQKEQSFGVRFGAHPDIQIALERVFTEALQGKNLEEFTKINQLSFARDMVNKHQNLFNTIKTGTGYYPSGLIDGVPLYPHRRWKSHEGESNRELAAFMTELILAETSQLYILDNSYLGFPSVCIYAEGMSELQPCHYSILKTHACKKQAASFLMDVNKMDEEKAEMLYMTGRLIRDSVLENTVSAMCELPIVYPFHGGVDTISFLMSVCCYYLGDYTGAVKELSVCMRKNDRCTDEYRYLSALLKLFKGQEAGLPPAQMYGLLVLLCGEETAQAVCEDFSERQKVFERVYPNCNHLQCGDCKLTGCAYQELRDFYGTLYKHFLESRVMTSRLHFIFSHKADAQGGAVNRDEVEKSR